jgi:hypothetical protein
MSRSTLMLGVASSTWKQQSSKLAPALRLRARVQASHLRPTVQVALILSAALLRTGSRHWGPTERATMHLRTFLRLLPMLRRQPSCAAHKSLGPSQRPNAWLQWHLREWGRLGLKAFLLLSSTAEARVNRRFPHPPRSLKQS